MLASWKQWCRLCAKERATFKLESVDVINGIIFPILQISIGDVPGDALAICEECYLFVNKLERFKERCEQTNRLFIYLSNFSDDEMDLKELEKLRSRYLGMLFLEDEVATLQEDFDAESQHLIDIVPIGELPNEGEDVRAVVGADVQQLLYRGHTEPTASDMETWESNEIDYEDVRSACYSDPASEDEKDKLDCMDDAETATKNPSPVQDGDKKTRKTSGPPSKARRTQRRTAAGQRPPFQCKFCMKTFSSHSYLKKHQSTHEEERAINLYACNFCDKTFNKTATIRAHIRLVHDGERPFICEECGKGFGSKGSLKEHYIVHTEERPFQCSQCPKRFKNAARLKSHEDIHNDTRYVCPHCGLQLNTKRTLNMHMVVHSDHKKYKCQYCGNEYKRSKALKAHLILHTGLRPYVCPFCDRTFANGSNCRSHKKKFHPIELAALEASGGDKPAANIPKLENLLLKPKNAANVPESSDEVVLSNAFHLAGANDGQRRSNTKPKTSVRQQKKTSHRMPVENRVEITS